jgi:hypothetical protein
MSLPSTCKDCGIPPSSIAGCLCPGTGEHAHNLDRLALSIEHCTPEMPHISTCSNSLIGSRSHNMVWYTPFQPSLAPSISHSPRLVTNHAARSQTSRDAPARLTVGDNVATGAKRRRSPSTSSDGLKPRVRSFPDGGPVKPSVGLLDLPNELLLKIYGYNAPRRPDLCISSTNQVTNKMVQHLKLGANRQLLAVAKQSLLAKITPILNVTMGVGDDISRTRGCLSHCNAFCNPVVGARFRHDLDLTKLHSSALGRALQHLDVNIMVSDIMALRGNARPDEAQALSRAADYIVMTVSGLRGLTTLFVKIQQRSILRRGLPAELQAEMERMLTEGLADPSKKNLHITFEPA